MGKLNNERIEHTVSQHNLSDVDVDLDEETEHNGILIALAELEVASQSVYLQEYNDSGNVEKAVYKAMVNEGYIIALKAGMELIEQEETNNVD